MAKKTTKKSAPKAAAAKDAGRKDAGKDKPRERPPMSDVTRLILQHASKLAKDVDAGAILLHADGLPDGYWEAPEALDARVIYITKYDETEESTDRGEATILRVPKVALSRIAQIKLSILMGLSSGELKAGQRLVCVSGAPEVDYLDTLVITEIGDEFQEFVHSGGKNPARGKVSPEVLTRVIDIAAELGSEGREGRPVGAIFVVGDTEAVLPLTRQLVLNAFAGYKPSERNLLDPALEETVKEFSTIDGAFIIQGDGVIVAAGAYLKTSGVSDEELPRGLGARHQAAAAITSVTEAIAITISHSTGSVTVFRNGRIVTEIEKPRRLERRRRREE